MDATKQKTPVLYSVITPAVPLTLIVAYFKCREKYNFDTIEVESATDDQRTLPYAATANGPVDVARGGAPLPRSATARRTPTRFASESQRFQRGNAWVAGLIARPRSISVRRGPVCSTAPSDRWTSCKSITRSSISSWSTMSNACPSAGRGSR
jgi:hypothetical protein